MLARVRMVEERDLSGMVLAGRYRVMGQIGGGGMGTVHAGEHLEVGRKVAIKILRPEAVARPALVERFRREARVTARIEHEHVVECLDVGVSDEGECFYVMEWLRGEDLQQLLRRERTLAWPRVRAIVAQVCRALAAAHERGVVHRDLKPGNIFLIQREDNRDFVKLLDFGIAKLMAPDEAPAEALTRTGEVVGTTPYMAPELAAGEPFDHRIDIYAAGVILYQLLAGRLPFRGRTPRQILVEILKGDPPQVTELNPSIVISPALAELLQKAMHRDAAQRFPDMGALHDALLDLPEDACRPADVEVAIGDSSASEVSMVASMIDPMFAASRDAEVDSGRMMATVVTRVTLDEPGTAIDPPRVVTPPPVAVPPVASRRRAGLVFAVALLGLAVVLGWVLWPRAAAPPVIVESADEGSVVAPVEVAGDAKPTAAPTSTQPTTRPPPTTPGPTSTSEAEAESSEPADSKSRGRVGFEDVMRKAAVKVRRCLGQGGVKGGTRVRFDIVVEANTGRITAATPRAPFAEQAKLGSCVVEAARGSSVRPAPSNEWRRSFEFAG